MRLEILHLPGCAGARDLEERLREVIGHQAGIEVSVRAILDDEEAAAGGMAGSPTLLVDGVDVFAAPGHPGGSLSCRLFRDGAGRADGAPTTERLRAVLGLARP
jgi:hypothetical protein